MYNPKVNDLKNIQSSSQILLNHKISEETMRSSIQSQKFVNGFYDSCLTKTIFSGVAGSVFGGFWGILSAALDGNRFDIEPVKMSALELKRRSKFKYKFMKYVRTTSSKAYFMAKAFGGVAVIFSVYECTIEKGRAKHDLYNVRFN